MPFLGFHYNPIGSKKMNNAYKKEVENENHVAFVLLSWPMNYLKHIYVLT